VFPSVVLRLHDHSHRRDLEEAVRAGQGDLAVGLRPDRWEGPVASLGFEEMVDLLASYSNSCAQFTVVQDRLEALTRDSAGSAAPDERSYE
jgi:hypothetical protein